MLLSFNRHGVEALKTCTVPENKLGCVVAKMRAVMLVSSWLQFIMRTDGLQIILIHNNLLISSHNGQI
jgi:hypothetical protein